MASVVCGSNWSSSVLGRLSRVWKYWKCSHDIICLWTSEFLLDECSLILVLRQRSVFPMWHEHAKSIQQNVRFECQTISGNIQKQKQEKFKDFQVLLDKFKGIQGLSNFVQTLFELFWCRFISIAWPVEHKTMSSTFSFLIYFHIFCV
jgi:hypothetical protein